ncbi:DNA repair protein RecO [Candidatus Woesebacteria bacterium RIFCSPLOWO2_01_FULL_37_19]|uniref:DNA repair protein RecO n=2 Tax=Candidatus Woeseibacteriota TaxID=1752722 RepID=A0A1F8B8N6_9BACT|nr:MAG: DNA repair protein RecO [Candidatus Woesebacteria bacterium RIFCSPHIGHO2_01_FULL_38_26b]OGM60403.1 MAG: DNA repair protein RecO [Candidatus Woesebacteria bacterium RIFCSPLOWO2_01_FULL_37_19]
MKPRSYSSEGIILSKRNYQEADKFIVVYSKDFGKQSFLAKGVRKTKSRKRGHLEVFNRIKFSVNRGKFFEVITEVETIDSFRSIRKNLRKVSVAYYFSEVIKKLTQEGEKNEELYNILYYYLKTIEKTSKNLRNLRYNFIYKVLVSLGFWPEGKKLVDPDTTLEDILERELTSVRVGKRILT